jgi:hypothetical protein
VKLSTVDRGVVSYDVYPITTLAGRSVTGVVGTGFLATSELLVTSWHSIRDAVEAGMDLAVVFSTPAGDYTALALQDVGQDEAGHDLASAIVPTAGPRGGFFPVLVQRACRNRGLDFRLSAARIANRGAAKLPGRRALSRAYCLAHRPPPEVRARWATKTREARGCGAVHKALRQRYAALVASGQAICARCDCPIIHGEPWDLGHVDGDRNRYAGAEHAPVIAWLERGRALRPRMRLVGATPPRGT